MLRISKALVCLVMGTLLLECERPVASMQSSRIAATTRDDWRRKASALLESGNCAQTIEYLHTIHKRDPLWYELASQAHMACWRHDRSKAHEVAALAIIDEGIRAFPQSSNLLLSRGYRHQELGDRDAALKDFLAAQDQARANLTNRSDAQSDAD